MILFVKTLNFCADASDCTWGGRLLKANAKRGTKEFVQYSGARTEGRAGAEVTVRLAPRARRLARTGCSADMAGHRSWSAGGQFRYYI